MKEKKKEMIIPFGGQACEETRTKLGVTRVYVAKQMNMDPSQLARYETGVAPTRYSLIEEFASALSLEKPQIIIIRAFEMYRDYLVEKFASNKAAVKGIEALCSLVDSQPLGTNEKGPERSVYDTKVCGSELSDSAVAVGSFNADA